MSSSDESIHARFVLCPSHTVQTVRVTLYHVHSASEAGLLRASAPTTRPSPLLDPARLESHEFFFRPNSTAVDVTFHPATPGAAPPAMQPARRVPPPPPSTTNTTTGDRLYHHLAVQSALLAPARLSVRFEHRVEGAGYMVRLGRVWIVLSRRVGVWLGADEHGGLRFVDGGGDGGGGRRQGCVRVVRLPLEEGEMVDRPLASSPGAGAHGDADAEGEGEGRGLGGWG
ncbi:hypothetical protein P8C59_002759 [Phyllachora maydis]|uniref:Uncharacterized protein n=1 Tax=Phyllachora maydis TaxID=1825666 RepID=A0AAD9I017_9PEZI|nr:hypothetical protein P8C59_002759 [Phyllachora maydis]